MPNHPCAPLPMCPMTHVPITPVPHLDLIGIGNMPVSLLPMCPIPPIPHIPCGPYWPCAPYPLYTIAPCALLPMWPITPVPQWVMGHIGNEGIGVHGVWVTSAMGPMGNGDTGGNGVQGYRVHRQWDPQGQSGTGGVGTGGMGHMSNKAHRGYGVQGVWGTWAIGHNDTFNLNHLSPHRAIFIGLPLVATHFVGDDVEFEVWGALPVTSGGTVSKLCRCITGDLGIHWLSLAATHFVGDSLRCFAHYEWRIVSKLCRYIIGSPVTID